MAQQIVYIHEQRRQSNISLRKYDGDTKVSHTPLNPIPKYTQKYLTIFSHRSIRSTLKREKIKETNNSLKWLEVEEKANSQ